MVKIRLRRMGTKKRPSYRIVAVDSRTSCNGKFIEIIGTYNPLTEPSTVVVDREKVSNWVNHGAQLSDRVAKLLDNLDKTAPQSEPKDDLTTKVAEQPEAKVNLEVNDTANDSPTIDTETQVNAEEKK
ncbi:MAG: 30S ribosomal protein S16 [Dehalococcoidia bacterium]|nr:30S ribosomal protein S16 [Dehalococcoidia bacterium]